MQIKGGWWELGFSRSEKDLTDKQGGKARMAHVVMDWTETMV